MSTLHVEPAVLPDAVFHTLPPVEVMAAAACMSVRSFRRALKVAEDTGWLVVRRGNRYAFTVPDQLSARAAEIEKFEPAAFGCGRV